ncbi:MAG: 50S ribosomal protein L18, partial [Roseibacillus sp.]|nr:50S ribosomal protein L18 [Roseibacillus sp.]
MSILNRKESRRKIHRRIRKKVAGTASRPRLAVHYSNKNIYAQIIDDEAGRTLCAASSLDKEVEASGSNVATAEKVGTLIANRAGGAS